MINNNYFFYGNYLFELTLDKYLGLDTNYFRKNFKDFIYCLKCNSKIEDINSDVIYIDNLILNGSIPKMMSSALNDSMFFYFICYSCGIKYQLNMFFSEKNNFKCRWTYVWYKLDENGSWVWQDTLAVGFAINIYKNLNKFIGKFIEEYNKNLIMV